MPSKPPRAPRRTDALSRDVIVGAAIEILDAEGETALTLRALTIRLSTGYGAIYHRIADRDELLAAATDCVIAPVVADLARDQGRLPTLRAIALGLFDAIVGHPWAGAQLAREPWQSTLLDIYEAVGRQMQELGVPQQRLSDVAGVLVNYILGVAGQNAANARALADSKMDRADFLADLAERWEQLDPKRYPTVRGARNQLRDHDDREQFLAGVEVILAGIQATNPPRKKRSPLPRRPVVPEGQ
jgi:AcrR family transcriptional regulator